MKLMIPGYLLPEIVTGNLLYFLFSLISLVQPFILFTNRSSQRTCSITKFTGKHPCQSLFSIDPRTVTLLKKRPQQRCFLVNFAKILRTPFVQNTSERLLLLQTQALTRFSWRCLI